MEVGRTIRLFRKLKCMSQEKVAKEAHIHRTYLSRIEEGKANPSLSKLQDIANALSVEPYQLLMTARRRGPMAIDPPSDNGGAEYADQY